MRKITRVRVRARPISEGVIEDRCVKLAKGRGWTARKMNGLGFRSWPDRFFLPPHFDASRVSAKRLGKRFWVEFKRPGEVSTPDQLRVQDDLRKRGEGVFVCDNAAHFLELLTAHEASK